MTAAWHPPRRVLEFTELVLSGVLDRLPEPVEAPDSVASALEHDGSVLLEDAEGTPVASLTSDGSVLSGKPFAHAPLRSRRLTPDAARAALGAPALAVVAQGAMSRAQVDAADSYPPDVPRIWIALIGDGRRVDLPPESLVRALDGASGGALVVPVAVPVLPDPDDDAALVDAVAAAYGAGEVLRLTPDRDSLLDEAGPTDWHPASARELGHALRPPSSRGVTVFFTGLSGSGKSTVAKGLVEALEAGTHRTVSLLDGDEVRRMLSAGLGFSRADRDLNILRIGYVATEITRHGGLAVCAPIAPFASVRAQVRAAVEEVGDFVLVHVSTPLEECERRDRKGLYAKARAGEVAEFTGISSPYEEPVDAELVIDTSERSVPDAVAEVLGLLNARGYLG